MAVNNNDDPVLEEYSSTEAHGRDSAQYQNAEFRGNLVTVSSETPLHRLHEDRVVRPAGRMVMGSPAPIPTLDDVLKETPLFSGRKPRRLGAIGTLAIAMACALAIVAAVGLTGVLNKNTVSNPPRKAAAPGTPAEKTQTTEKFVAGQVASNTPQTRPEPIPTVKGSSPSAEQPVVARMETPQQRLMMDTQSNFSVKSIAGYAGEPLPVSITLPSAQPEEYSFVMFRGLPSEISMSAGFRLKGSWVVSLRDLEGLVVQSQLDFEGKFNLEVMLIKGRDVPAESRTIVVSIEKRGTRAPNANAVEDIFPAPAQKTADAGQPPKIVDQQATRTVTREQVTASAGGTPATSQEETTRSVSTRANETPSKKNSESSKAARLATVQPEPKPAEVEAAPMEQEASKADDRAPVEMTPAEAAPAETTSIEPAPTGASVMPTISPEEEGPLLERAAQFLEKYDVANARLLFEHLARSGSAKGALALGQTYDPTYFHTTEIRGMKPDVAKAKEWYKRAVELGDQEANKRLTTLGTP